MSIDHVNITDPFIHQPKGASTASSNTTIIANGSGGTSWAKVGINNVDQSSIKNLNQYGIQTRIADLGNAVSTFVIAPTAGTITGFFLVNDEAMATTNTIVSLKIAGVTVTNGAVTLLSSATAGTLVSTVPTAANVVTAGSVIEIASDGGTTGTSSAHVVLIVSI